MGLAPGFKTQFIHSPRVLLRKLVTFCASVSSPVKWSQLSLPCLLHRTRVPGKEGCGVKGKTCPEVELFGENKMREIWSVGGTQDAD